MRCPRSLVPVAGVAAILGTLASDYPAARRIGVARERTLSLPEVEPKRAPRSTVPLVVGVEMAWAKQRLEEQVPVKLHQESDREVARGIFVDVSVVRGPIDLGLREDWITLTAPIQLDLDVRSKFGSFVARLGHCHSTIDVEVSLSARLSPEGTLGTPRSRATLREPCRLASFDVTPFIEREIEQRLAVAQAQASEHLGRANRFVSELNGQVSDTLSRPSWGCLRLVPERVQQSRLVEEHGVARTGFALVGTLGERCDQPSPSRLPIESIESMPRFDIAWSRRTSFEELNNKLAQRFADQGNPGVEVRTRSVRRDSEDQLALWIRSPRREGWVFAQPRIANGTVLLAALASKSDALLKFALPALRGFTLPIDARPAEILGQQLAESANELTVIFGSSSGLKDSYEIPVADLCTSAELLVDRDSILVTTRRQQPPCRPADGT